MLEESKRKKEMKILVIDDNPINLKSAEQTLVGHELTLCGDLEDALELVGGGCRQKSVSPFYDVVLTDLQMPAPKFVIPGARRKKFKGDVTIGWAFALYAARSGAKWVAMATSTNHHDHPASAVLDGMRAPMSIEGARVMFTNTIQFVGVEGTTCDECGGSLVSKGSNRQCFGCVSPYTSISTGKKLGKDWKRVLDTLTSS